MSGRGNVRGTNTTPTHLSIQEKQRQQIVDEEQRESYREFQAFIQKLHEVVKSITAGMEKSHTLHKQAYVKLRDHIQSLIRETQMIHYDESMVFKKKHKFMSDAIGLLLRQLVNLMATTASDFIQEIHQNKPVSNIPNKPPNQVSSSQIKALRYLYQISNMITTIVDFIIDLFTSTKTKTGINYNDFVLKLTKWLYEYITERLFGEQSQECGINRGTYEMNNPVKYFCCCQGVIFAVQRLAYPGRTTKQQQQPKGVNQRTHGIDLNGLDEYFAKQIQDLARTQDENRRYSAF